jgi:MoaA/NifB/PqqE/SkfB family radical SAM enzyme/4-hydroxybenzoate polyprenyltransferase
MKMAYSLKKIRFFSFMNELVRWSEWYNSKLPLIALISLYSILNKNLPLSLALKPYALTLIFVILYLAFGYLINDLSDCEVDIKAGKIRAVHKLPKIWGWIIAIIISVIGILSLSEYYDRPFVSILVCACYVLAVVYSLPPLRLKERGWWGLISASAAQRSLPALIAAAVFDHINWDVGIFAILYLLIGLRWILIHQIEDFNNDLKTGVQTYVTQQKDNIHLKSLQKCIFGMEVLCLVILLTYLGWILPVFLIVYGAYVTYIIWLHRVYRKVNFNISLFSYVYVPLADFYLIIWPLSLALYLSTRDTGFFLIVGLEILWKWTYARRQAFNFVIRCLIDSMGFNSGASNSNSVPKKEKLTPNSKTNKAGMTFLDNVDEIALALYGDRYGNTLQAQINEYRINLEKSFLTDTPLIPPIYSTLKVTNRCNSYCRYCSSYGKGKKVNYEPSTLELIRIIGQMADLGVKSINFTGGESTLRPDLPKLIVEARNMGMVPNLLTNGLLLTRQCESLVKAGIEYIIISMDSLSDDAFRYLRGSSIHEVLNGLNAVVGLRNKVYPRLVIGVTAVITRFNLNNLPILLTKLTEQRISLQITPYHHFNPSEPDNFSPLDEVELRNVIERLIDMRSNGYLLVNSNRYLQQIPDYIFRKKLPTSYRCYVGFIGIFVDGDLNVRPCWSWSLPIIGNLQKGYLNEIWYSEAFQKGRKKIRHLDCSKCWLLCTSEFSLRFLDI